MTDTTSQTPPPLQRKKQQQKLGWLKKGIIAVLGFFAIVLLMDLVVMPLYVKSGEKGVVPKVIGKQVEIAMKELDDAGFEPINYETQYDDKVKEGIIIRQTPEGGEETKPGRKVYLIVSGGKETFVVPDLIGKTLKDARTMIIRANLDIGKTEYVFADSTVSGTVYRQKPAPGTKASSVRRVDLVVTQGPRTGKVEVPYDIIGVSLEEAILRLSRVGLHIGKTTFEEREEGRPGTVYDMYPSSGDLIDPGSSIDLFIVKDKLADPTPEEGGGTEGGTEVGE